MIDKRFLRFLECSIGPALSKSSDIERRRCWCDGVYIPEDDSDYSIQRIQETQMILAKAWIDEGKSKEETFGQHLYDMVIWFGDETLRCYKENGDLTSCIPSVQNEEWILLDRKDKMIEIQLL